MRSPMWQLSETYKMAQNFWWFYDDNDMFRVDLLNSGN